MADDPWAKYIKGAETGVPGVVEEDPWQKYYVDDKSDMADRTYSKMLPNLDKMKAADPALKRIMENALKYPRMDAVLMEAAKGVPIAGAFVPQTKEMDFMEKNWPGFTAGANIAGGVGSMALPMGAAANATRGMGLLPQIGAQSSLNAAANIGDVAARKGGDVTAKDIAVEGAKGAAWGSLGPLFGKAISPGKSNSQIMKAISPAERKELIKDAAGYVHRGHTYEEAIRIARQNHIDGVRGAAAQRTEGAIRSIGDRARSDTPHDIFYRMMIGGLPSAVFSGGHPWITAAGAAAGLSAPYVREVAPKMAGKYAHNIFAQGKTTQDVLNILSQSGNQATSNDQVNPQIQEVLKTLMQGAP